MFKFIIILSVLRAVTAVKTTISYASDSCHVLIDEGVSGEDNGCDIALAVDDDVHKATIYYNPYFYAFMIRYEFSKAILASIQLSTTQMSLVFRSGNDSDAYNCNTDQRFVVNSTGLIYGCLGHFSQFVSASPPDGCPVDITTNLPPVPCAFQSMNIHDLTIYPAYTQSDDEQVFSLNCHLQYLTTHNAIFNQETCIKYNDDKIKLLCDADVLKSKP